VPRVVDAVAPTPDHDVNIMLTATVSGLLLTSIHVEEHSELEKNISIVEPVRDHHHSHRFSKALD